MAMSNDYNNLSSLNKGIYGRSDSFDGMTVFQEVNTQERQFRSQHTQLSYQELFEKCSVTLTSIQQMKNEHTIEKRDSIVKIRDLEAFNMVLKENLTALYLTMKELTNENDKLRDIIDHLQMHHVTMRNEFLSRKRYWEKKHERLEQNLKSRQHIDEKKFEMISMLLKKCVRNDVPIEAFQYMFDQSQSLYSWGQYGTTKFVSEMLKKEDVKKNETILYSLFKQLARRQDIEAMVKKVNDDREWILKLLEKYNFDQEQLIQKQIIRDDTDPDLGAQSPETTPETKFDPVSKEQRNELEDSEELHELLSKKLDFSTGEFEYFQSYCDKLAANIIMQNNSCDTSLVHLGKHFWSMFPIVFKYDPKCKEIFSNIKSRSRAVKDSLQQLKESIENFSSSFQVSMKEWTNDAMNATTALENLSTQGKKKANLSSKKSNGRMTGGRRLSTSLSSGSLKRSSGSTGSSKGSNLVDDERNKCIQCSFGENGFVDSEEFDLLQQQIQNASFSRNIGVRSHNDLDELMQYYPSPPKETLHKSLKRSKKYNIPGPTQSRTVKRLCECQICTKFKLQPKSAIKHILQQHTPFHFLDSSDWFELKPTPNFKRNNVPF